jgi:hypothetical protein
VGNPDSHAEEIVGLVRMQNTVVSGRGVDAAWERLDAVQGGLCVVVRLPGGGSPILASLGCSPRGRSIGERFMGRAS